MTEEYKWWSIAKRFISAIHTKKLLHKNLIRTVDLHESAFALESAIWGSLFTVKYSRNATLGVGGGQVPYILCMHALEVCKSYDAHTQYTTTAEIYS